jgi:hypothetical protein
MTALEMTKRVEKLTHYLSHAWNLINSYYSNKSEREELFFKKIDHINVQIADISHRLIGMGTQLFLHIENIGLNYLFKSTDSSAFRPC